MGLFSADGALYKFITRFWDLCKINFLWVVFSIPIVTIGPATVAAFSILLKMCEEREGYIVKPFWREFKKNLNAKSIGLGLIFIVIAYSIYLDTQLYNAYQDTNMGLVFLISALVVGFIFYLSFVYAFPLMARYENTLLGTIKNSHAVATRYFLKTLGLAVIIAVLVLLFNWNQLLMIIGAFFAPACIMYTIAAIAMGFFRLIEKEPGAVSNPEAIDEENKSN